jgi:hypothetical protein
MGPEQRYGQWDYFYVFLGRPFAAGELTQVDFRVDLYPDHFSAVEPYVYLDGANPVPSELVLRVQLPDKGPPIAGKCLVIRRSDNRVVDASLPEIIPDHNEAVWRTRPRLGSQYHLRWEWPDEWFELSASSIQNS